MIKEHLPLEIVEKVNDSELAVYYKNGSIQRFVGCEDIDKHRGISPIDVVFDEFSEMNPEIWTAVIQPILRENKGTASFIFTPKGRNHSWQLLQQVKENPEWFSQIITSLETNVYSELELEKIKLNTPQALFEQEYLCQFLDDASSVFRNIDNRTETFELFPEQGKRYQMGVDLAKHNDWTCITITDKHTFRTQLVDRFNKIDWDFQLTKIESWARRFNGAEVWIDSTGVGDPIYDILAKRGLNIQPFSFNERSREQLLNNLSILLEQNKITLARNDELINEIKSFRYLLHGKKVKAEVPENQHDDTVMSLALAVWGLNQKLPDPRYDMENIIKPIITTYN